VTISFGGTASFFFEGEEEKKKRRGRIRKRKKGANSCRFRRISIIFLCVIRK